MTTSRNPFAFPGEITLDTLPQLFEHHRFLTGGWGMDTSGGSGGDGGGAGGDGSGAGGAGDTGAGGQGGGAGSGRTNATDSQGNDLGFPKDTPIAEMTDKEQAAYWRNISRKHEGRFKDIVGDRDPADVKKDLDAYAQLQREQQTPAEQALADAHAKGNTEGITSARNEAATAVFRGALEAGGITGDDLDEITANFNVAAYVTDTGIDTAKITNFAKRFTPSGKDGDQQQQRRRDYGGGNRQQAGGERQSAGKAEAARRFQKKTD